MKNTRPLIAILSTFYTPFVSGAERFAVEAAERLAPEHRIIVVTARLSRALPQQEVCDGYEICRVGFGTRFDKWFFPLLAPIALWRLRPSIAHAVLESYAGIALWFFSFLSPHTPRILTLQGGDLDDPKKQRRIPAWLWRRIHTTPDLVTGISRFLCARATRLRGGEQGVILLPNGIDLTRIPPRETAVPGRIVCVARLAWEKGHADLLEAVALLKKTRPDTHLVLVGDGPLHHTLTAQARALGLGDAVTFLGKLSNEDALKEVAKASVFVCPSLAEGLGIVFLEAQAIGVPVVGTNVGGIPDVIRDGETGLLVPPHEPEVLARAIERFWKDPAFAASCVARAKETVTAFTWQSITTQLSQIYTRFLARKRIVLATGIFPPAIGGPATYTAALAPALVERGWDVTVLTYGMAETKSLDTSSRLVVVNAKLPTGIRHAMYFLRSLQLFRRADVAYLQDPVSVGVPGIFAARLLRKPVIVKIVGDYAWEQGQQRAGVTDLLDLFQTKRYGFFVEGLRHVQQFVVRRATRIITPSAYLSRIVAGWGVPLERIAIVANAVEPIEEDREVTALADRAPEIVTAARLLPWKGIRELVESLVVIRVRVPNARLTIIGDGPLRATIEEDVARLGLKDAVTLTGRLSREEVLARIRTSRVFVLWSSYEGFSHQLIEAMACGTPVVASPAGGNADVVVHEENALVVPYGEKQALADAVARLLEDAPLAIRIASRARETAKLYTPERMVSETDAVLSAVCVSPSA